MKNKKVLIMALTAILVIAILVILVANPVFAAPTDPANFNGNYAGGTTADDIVSKILGFIQFIGSALAVIMLVVIGIKYMVGSAEEKAEYKKTLVPYVVGAILIFAASNIASWVYHAVVGS